MAIAADYDLGSEIIEHMTSLRRYARCLVQAPDAADDLVQDCLARAIDRSHLYEPNTDLRAWLFTILRNIFLTQARVARYRRSRARDYTAMVSGVAAPNQLHAVALKESLQFVKTLPVGERQAVLLVGMFDMSYAEAARHSGAKLGTVKSRASRGRAQLRLLTQPVSAVERVPDIGR
jgi:RNA polymerase sigma-70 factor (ECF subfamily)